MNTVELLKAVRIGINEYEEDFMSGEDTTCAHSNNFLLQCINKAQDYLYNVAIQYFESQMIIQSELSISNSQAVLPKFKKIIALKDENKENIISQSVSDIQETSRIEKYHIEGSTLYLEAEEVTDTFTLWYVPNCKELTMGYAVSGQSGEMGFEKNAYLTKDYYKDQTLVNLTANWSASITGYENYVATFDIETANKGDQYALQIRLPEFLFSILKEESIITVKRNSGLLKNPSVPQQRAHAESLMTLLQASPETDTAYNYAWEGQREDLQWINRSRT